MAKKKYKVESQSIAREWLESIIIALLLAIFIRTFLIQPFKIPSSSMVPTLIIKDRLMVNKLCYGPKIPFMDKRLPGFRKPKRGDIIVFVYPVDPKKDFIKRLIAFGGETVEIWEGDILINGKAIFAPWADKFYYYNYGKFGQEYKNVKVPEGHVFVLGDNSASSSDSRVWGFVPEKNIVGKAEFIYWPFTRLRMLK